MPKRLPADVAKFLLDNLKELERVVATMKATESNAKWRAELAEKRKNAKMVPCGTYGCTQPKNEMDVFCDSCAAEYREDPDAFK